MSWAVCSYDTEADSGRTCTAEPVCISNPAELWLNAKEANNIKAFYKYSEVNDNDLQQCFSHFSPGDSPVSTSSRNQQGPRNTSGDGVGCFGMGCAGDRYTRDDLLWVNPSRQLRPHSCLITLPKSDGERPGRAKVRKLMDWDKDSFIGTAKAMHATKEK